MPHPEQHYHWSWTLSSPPAALWPLVSNTDRFNRDCGYPPVQPAPRSDGTANGDSRRLRSRVLGVPIEWDELAFEWIATRRFGVERVYHRGPLARMIVMCELVPTATGGTQLSYDMRITPAGWLGRWSTPWSIGRHARTTMERVFRQYDAFARNGLTQSALARPPMLAVGGSDRLRAAAAILIARHRQPEELVRKLENFIGTADDLAVARMRPYALADEWRTSRRETLHVFLHATRAGLLDFSWQLICPHCRGAQSGLRSLTEVTAEAHCDSCNVDFTANFDQSVELTFHPNPSIRGMSRLQYCVGGPHVTPHIVAQQRIPAGARCTFQLAARPGRYRIRSPGIAEQSAFRLAPDGANNVVLELGHAATDERSLAPGGELKVVNATSESHLAVIEHLAWSDQATTAAEVTSLQLFRDLFSREVLRPGERISVGSMTVVFTDLKNSTRLYQEIGDAPAFGRVLTHFEMLKAAVAAEGGGIVKTMGDAIMAVFPRPVTAVRAMLHAQRWLAQPHAFPLPDGVAVPPSSLQPLALKAGIHTGSCLAINQNERLDYFGTTVNVAARLCAQCTGTDLVLSDNVYADPEVASYFTQPSAPQRQVDRVRLKGFGDTLFGVHRVQPA